jgi:hypothetical protein
LGYSFITGDLKDFAIRSRNEGGLDIYPGVSMIGYQFEKQYIGTENFSALGEVLFNISGLEQGIFLPSITFMNGFRIGKAGWEFAFGPGFGIKQVSTGFFDTEGVYGNAGRYWTENEYRDYSFNKETGEHTASIYAYGEHMDSRGKTFKLNTRWVMALGRTFRAGALNIPVNVFYSTMDKSGMVGLSVGFNIIQ